MAKKPFDLFETTSDVIECMRRLGLDPKRSMVSFSPRMGNAEIRIGRHLAFRVSSAGVSALRNDMHPNYWTKPYTKLSYFRQDMRRILIRQL
jgi:hypothetical protein